MSQSVSSSENFFYISSDSY